MTAFPAFFDLSSRVALVVGGTRPAIDRARLLRESGAAIRLVVAESSPAIERLALQQPVDWRRRAISPVDLYDVALAFVATGDRLEDERAARAAQAARVPVSVHDRPDLSDFFVPTVQAGAGYGRNSRESGVLAIGVGPIRSDIAPTLWREDWSAGR